MINIFKILNKIPNLGDRIFYSPLYGNVKVSFSRLLNYPIKITENSLDTGTSVNLTEEGKFSIKFDGECLLYPSRQNKDWSTFKIRKDLPEGTPVVYSPDLKFGWSVGKYYKESQINITAFDICIEYAYIVPANKFNFKTNTFNPEDNYGTAYKE